MSRIYIQLTATIIMYAVSWMYAYMHIAVSWMYAYIQLTATIIIIADSNYSN